MWSASPVRSVRPRSPSWALWPVYRTASQPLDRSLVPVSSEPTPSESEFKAALSSAWPLALAFGGDQLLGVIDSLVAGRMGPVALAAVGVGNAIFMGLTIFGVGLIGAVEPLASQAFGMQREDLARRAYRSAVVVSVAATIPFVLGVQALGGLVADWGQLDPETKTAVISYLFMRSFSVLPVFLTTAARNYLQSRQDTRAIVWSTVIANLLNVPLSILLGFGDAALVSTGLPGLGFGAGMGVAGVGAGVNIGLRCASHGSPEADSEGDAQPQGR